jgi:Primase C terminal 1 (PriCT-1)
MVLSPFRGVVPPPQQEPKAAAGAAATNINKGSRNNALFRACMKRAHSCANLDELLAFARDVSAYYQPPMEESEVMKVANSAWGYTERGENRFGQHGAYFATEEVAALLPDPDAFLLLAFLRAHNGPWAQFMISNSLCHHLGWRRQRLTAARQRLLDLGYIEQIRPAAQHTPALFQWP